MPHSVTIKLGAHEADSNSAEGLPHPALVKTPGVTPRDPAGAAVALALRTAIERIATLEQGARSGDREGVHRLRSACRRLRSELRAFEHLVETTWRERTEGELKWLAGLLGDARDLDILLARLRASAGELEGQIADPASLAPLFTGLEARRSQAARRVASSLLSARYRALVEALEESALRPPLEETAGRACRAVLPEAAKSAWRRLRKSARGLRRNDAAEKFHEARKRAKGARYTAELIAPLLGRGAARDASEFIRLTGRVQDALGEHQDALITAGELERAVEEHADQAAFVHSGSVLLEDQQKRARAARVRFFKIWSKLDRKKLRRWMRPRGHGEPQLDNEPAAVGANGYHT